MSLPSFYLNVYPKGNQLFVRAIEDGRTTLRRVDYKPTLYIPDANGADDWKTISGAGLRPMAFDGIYDAKDFLKQYSGIDNLKIHGLPRFAYSYLNEKYPKTINYDSTCIRTVYLDIEVNSSNGFPNVEAASEPITAITAKDNTGYYVFGCGEFINNGAIPNLKYKKCHNEQDILLSFLNFWEGNGHEHPTIVTGWNITAFDLPYIAKRLASVIGVPHANRLSPWNIISERKGFDKMGKETTYLEIAGVSNLDYYELYRKFTYSQQENYRLGHIASVELGEQKKDYQDYQTLHSLFTENYQAFIEYNIHDVTLVERLEDKMKLIELALTIAYDAKVNYEDVFMQVRLWDVLIHNYLYERKIAVVSEGGGHKDEAYVGAYVKDPQVGRHDWVMSFDVNSMYPNLIRMFNISPETILNECYNDLKVDDILQGHGPAAIPNKVIAANGWLFRTNVRGFLPEMMERMGKDRNDAKRKMQAAEKRREAAADPIEKNKANADVSKWKNMQLAKKVQLNAAYGALGNNHFRHFNIKLATAITLGGQLIIRYAEQEINKFLNVFLGGNPECTVDYVIASDTDSLYLKMESVVNTLCGIKPTLTKDEIVTKLNTFAEKHIVPEFARMFAHLAKSLGAQEDAMVMKREAIADAGIWTAKKRYILNVLDNEGVRYAKPKLKMMGIEAVKSSTPSSCRKAIIKAIEIIVSKTETEVQTFIAEYSKEFSTLPFEDIAFPRSVSGLNKYATSQKSVPIHVRGALAYNALIASHELENKYDTIHEGEKIKFCYLLTPNPIQSHVIAAITILPSEFKLDAYLDYQTQFEKSFIDPIKAILAVVGWKEEPTQTLEDFFV